MLHLNGTALSQSESSNFACILLGWINSCHFLTHSLTHSLPFSFCGVTIAKGALCRFSRIGFFYLNSGTRNVCQMRPVENVTDVWGSLCGFVIIFHIDKRVSCFLTEICGHGGQTRTRHCSSPWRRFVLSERK